MKVKDHVLIEAEDLSHIFGEKYLPTMYFKKLEKEALDYIRNEKEFNADRKLVDYGHMRRTISLLKINEELSREIKKFKSCEKEELGLISDKPRGRIKELNCPGGSYHLASIFVINGLAFWRFVILGIKFQNPRIKYSLRKKKT